MGKSYYLIVALIILFVGSITYKYYHFVIDRNFTIISKTSCDPAFESCFVSDCLNVEDGTCDRVPYKTIHKKAKYMDVCNDAYEGCKELSCALNEPGCEIILCSDETLGEGEVCLFESVSLQEVTSTLDSNKESSFVSDIIEITN